MDHTLRNHLICHHGPYGIICGHNWYVGKQCTIYHQVTLAGGGKIGDGVVFGAGSKVLKGVTIGSNVRVGANAVVIEDIPDGATVVLQRPRIITPEKKKSARFQATISNQLK